ncbi:hypothetical protein [Winogradskyella sp. R77965]|uniref:hypothetical protein n=1 Tax=Winogradskyella sp. R77965 TaxID=3093872 RepID=UPI0037DCF726
MKTNKIRPLLLLIGISVLTHSCKSLKSQKKSTESKFDQLFLYQNGKEKIISQESESITIDKNNFSLRFYNKKYNSEAKEYYSAQVAAFLDIEDLDKVKIGMKKQELSCFNSGSGMAPDYSGKYENLIFNSTGSHYLIYKNSDSKRLNLLNSINEYQKLEFEINRLYYNNASVSMKDTQLSTFYLAILIDRNLNGVIENNELTKMIIQLN